jgi:transcriptional regulator with XRE-family HTH domain
MRRPNTNLISEIIGKGFYQKEVAAAAGLSESVMSMIVRGKYVPDDSQRERIARVLNVSPQKIFSENEQC